MSRNVGVCDMCGRAMEKDELVGIKSDAGPRAKYRVKNFSYMLCPLCASRMGRFIGRRMGNGSWRAL